MNSYDVEESIKKAKQRARHRFWLRGLKLVNTILITVPFVLCWLLYYAKLTRTPIYWRGSLYIEFLFFVVYWLCCKAYDATQISTSRISELIYSQALSILVADAILYLLFIILAKGFVHIWPLFISYACQVFLSVLWSTYAHQIYFKRTPPQRTIVIWDGYETLQELVNSYGLDKRFQVINSYEIGDIINDLSLLEGIEAVFLCNIHSHDRNVLIKYCVANSIRVYVIPRIGDAIMDSAAPIHLFHLPMLKLERSNPSPEYIIIKRAFDIFASSITLLLLSPVMLVITVLVQKDGGSVFYKQKRLTKDGRVFNMLKFRSMCMDAEKDGIARLSSGENDDRITKIGRIIRASRLDELPQLWNILVGDMSIVGPRPERPEIADQYAETIPEFSLRLQVKAGLTGYAQVYGKYNTTPYNKLLMDLRYIAHPSIAEDLRIILATIKILFLPESTEGVTEGAVTAMDRKGKEYTTKDDDNNLGQ